MKKLVLIMVFVLLMALFIAFNYLLWDRESMRNDLKNLEYTNLSNSADISAQNRDIKRLENEANQYVADISELEKDKELLEKRNLELESDIAQESQRTRHKIDIINILKENVDIKLFEAPVKKWADAVDTGNYGEAYRLEYEKASLLNKQTSLEDYTNVFKNNIKSLKIKEVLLDKDVGKADGEIALTVTLEVKLTEKPEQDCRRFTEGLNEIKVDLDYDVTLNEFFITNITK